MLTLAYRHVDVFSRYACQGNGLVVVPGADGLPTMVQQQLTREMRQFETVFLSSVDLPVGPRDFECSPRMRSWVRRPSGARRRSAAA